MSSLHANVRWIDIATMRAGISRLILKRRQLWLIAGNITTLAAQRVVQRVAGLVSLYFLVRHLSQADFGYYQFAAVALATASVFSLTGLDNALMQATSRGSSDFYRRATGFSLKFSTLGALTLLGGALASAHFQAATFGPLVVAACLFIPYKAMGQWKSVLLGEARFPLLAVIESLTALLTHSGLVVTVFLEVQELWIFVILLLTPTAITNMVATFLFWRRCPTPKPNVDSERLFRYGLDSSAVTVVSIVGEQIERVAIFFLLSPATLALYLAGDRLSELVRSVFQDAAAVMAPRFARMSAYDGNLQRAIWLLCTLASVIILVFAFTLAPTVMLLIFGPTYEPSIPYAQALLCSVAIGNVGQFQVRFIRSQIDSHSFSKITLWTSSARIVGSISLIVAFDVWGAVAALVCHRLTLSIVTSMLIRRKYRSTDNSPPTGSTHQ